MVELPWAGQIYFMVGLQHRDLPVQGLCGAPGGQLYGIDRVSMHKALGFGVGQPYDYPYSTPGTMGHDETILKYDLQPRQGEGSC